MNIYLFNKKPIKKKDITLYKILLVKIKTTIPYYFFTINKYNNNNNNNNFK